MKKYNVGISIAPGPEDSIWNSGLTQNIAFLAMLLKASPRVGQVWLINGGTLAQMPPGLGFDTIGVPLVRPESITHEIDLAIEFGVTLPPEWLNHIQALGAKVVTFFVGHTYAGQAEGPIFGAPTNGGLTRSPRNEVWTLPHHMKTSGPMLQTVARVPVRSLPHIWSPMFLDRQVREMGALGEQFGFRPASERKPWRAAIFEPNISVVKNCFIPMLVCEHAYRVNPDAVGLMMAVNTFHMKEHATFNAFARNLDLTRHSKATYEPRLPFPICMAESRIDAVVAHQWECGLNYAYYDALHGGYPLIHNSDFLRDAGMGFHYNQFSATEGGAAFLRAWNQEPDAWRDYKANAAAWLRTLEPTSGAHVKTYSDRIADLMEHA